MLMHASHILSIACMQVMAIAGRALKANITTLAPLILPFSEQAKFLLNLAARKV